MGRGVSDLGAGRPRQHDVSHTFPVSCDLSEKEAFQKACDASGASMSEVLRQLMKDYVKHHPTNNKRITDFAETPEPVKQPKELPPELKNRILLMELIRSQTVETLPTLRGTLKFGVQVSDQYFLQLKGKWVQKYK